MSQHIGAPSGTVISGPPRPPTGPPGGVGQGGPGRARRRVLLGLGAAGVVVVLLVLLVLLVPTSFVDRYTRSAVADYGGDCAELLGIDVDSGDWPVVARAAAGSYHHVTTHVDELRVDGFSYYDVSFSADKIHVAPLFGLLSGRETQVRGGEASATVRYDDIEAAIASYGYTVDLTTELTADGSLVANVDVPWVGPIPTTVEITPVDGDMELVFAPLDVIELPPVLIPFPSPTALREVVVGDDTLRVESTVEGALRSDDLGCDTTSNAVS
jgi:hypothetical protein